MPYNEKTGKWEAPSREPVERKRRLPMVATPSQLREREITPLAGEGTPKERFPWLQFGEQNRYIESEAERKVKRFTEPVGKAVEAAFEPFAAAGAVVLSTIPGFVTPEVQEKIDRRRSEHQSILEEARARGDKEAEKAERQSYAKFAREAYFPKGVVRERFEEYPWYVQMLAELPGFAAASPAFPLNLFKESTKLAAKPGIPGALGKAGQVALAPGAFLEHGAQETLKLGAKGVKGAMKWAFTPKYKEPQVVRDFIRIGKENFDKLAKKGKLAPFGGETSKELAATASGAKPVSLISKLDIDEARYLGLTVKRTPQLKGKHVDDVSAVFAAYKRGNQPAVKRLFDVLNKEESGELVGRAAHIEVGRALGYTDSDIAFYLKNLYGSYEAFAKGVSEKAMFTGEYESTLKKVTELLKEAKPLRAEAAKLSTQELKKRSARIHQIISEGAEDQPRELLSAIRQTQKGRVYEMGDLTPFQDSLTPQELDALFRQIWKSPNVPERLVMTKANAAEALEDLLLFGKIPTQSRLVTLEQVFGEDFAKVLLAKRPFGQKLEEAVFDLINLPKSVMAAVDLSGMLRQGGVLFWGHLNKSVPAIKPMLKAFGSEKYADDVARAIATKGQLAEREVAELYIADFGSLASKLGTREESFISRLAHYFPLVRRSERAFVTYLNKLRVDVFDSTVVGWKNSGKKFNDNDLLELGKFINRATGRGSLGKKLEPSAVFLNTLLFSPRLQLSRPQLILSLFSSSPTVRKMAIKDILAFVGVNTTMASLLHMSGLATVELDPRSADFAKIKIGNT
ncbi:MAG: hypothetical protein ACXABY_03500, partial [Candidatus Thorarchaeota archaeon]